MECSECGAEVLADSRFCSRCGAQVGRDPGQDRGMESCTNCGGLIGPTDQFCPSCGNSVRAALGGRFNAASSQRDVEYMGFWIRLVAEIVDNFVFFGGIAIMSALSTLTSYLWIIFVPVIAYFAYKHLKCQTIGRKILGIRVVDGAGDDVSFWRGALRETIGKFLSAVFLYLGFIWVAFDREKRGWHDKIAGTYVIKRNPAPPSF